MTDESQLWQRKDSFIYLLMPDGFHRGVPRMKNRAWTHFNFDPASLQTSRTAWLTLPFVL
jgi:hypothetical protein